MSNSCSPWIFITHKCNMNCKYCMVNRSENTITKDNFEYIIRVFENLLEDGQYDTINPRISGGEPLLYFDRFHESIERIKRKVGSKMSFNLLTNGLLIDKNIAAWLKAYDVGVYLSLDDMKNGKLIDNIQLLTKNKVKIGFCSVVGKEPIVEVAHFISSFPFRLNWNIQSDFFSKEEDTLAIFENIKEALLALRVNNFDLTDVRIYSTQIGSSFGDCMAGTESNFTIDTNLDVLSCQASNKVLGKFDEKIKQVLRDTYNYVLPKKCKDCFLLNMCNGGCKESKSKTYCSLKKALFIYINSLLSNQIFTRSDFDHSVYTFEPVFEKYKEHEDEVLEEQVIKELESMNTKEVETPEV